MIETMKELSWHYTVDQQGAIQHLNNSSGSKFYPKGDARNCQEIVVLTIGSGSQVDENVEYLVARIRKTTNSVVYDER